jgi:hypothetical protein
MIGAGEERAPVARRWRRAATFLTTSKTVMTRSAVIAWTSAEFVIHDARQAVMIGIICASCRTKPNTSYTFA